MPTTPIPSEPYVKLYALVGAQAELLTLIGNRYGRSRPMDEPGYPMLTWSTLSLAQNEQLDVELHEYHEDLVQFSAFGTDDEVLQRIAALVDVMNDANFKSPGVLDTAHYRCAILRRASPWRNIPWTKQGADGNDLIQLASDWRFKYLRKENVA